MCVCGGGVDIITLLDINELLLLQTPGSLLMVALLTYAVSRYSVTAC